MPKLENMSSWEAPKKSGIQRCNLELVHYYLDRDFGPASSHLLDQAAGAKDIESAIAMTTALLDYGNNMRLWIKRVQQLTEDIEEKIDARRANKKQRI